MTACRPEPHPGSANSQHAAALCEVGISGYAPDSWATRDLTNPNDVAVIRQP
jgi:hypothetical protein